MKKLFENWIVALTTMLLIALVFTGGYHFAIRPKLDKAPIVGGEGAEMVSVPSESCIACHTDESVIAASTVGQEEEEEEASGG